MKASPEAPKARQETSGGRWEQLAGRRPWAVAGVLVAVPALAAGATIAALPADTEPAGTAVTVTKTDCAPEWTAGTTGTHTFTVTNNSGLAGEVNLDNAASAVVGELETIGPGTSAQLTATLGRGVYTFKCLMGSEAATASQAVQVTGTAADATAPVGVKPVTVKDLTPANDRYQAYAAAQLADLARQVTTIAGDLRRNDIANAKQDWLAAQLDWERVGASYDSFGDLGLAVDGLPDGLTNGVNDKAFTGLHRLEYGLWHGQSATELEQVTSMLATNVAAVRQNLTTDGLAGDPVNLPVRAHEILEDALRDHLSGLDDEGGGAALAQTYADVQVTRTVLGYLAPLIDARQPGLVATLTAQLDALGQQLLATGGPQPNGALLSLGAASLSAREHVDAATGAVLESLASVPDLLEVPPTH